MSEDAGNASIAGLAPDRHGPEGYHPQKRDDIVAGRRQRRVQVGTARDDDGTPVRIANFHEACGARVFAGFHDFDGFTWSTRYYESEDADAEILTRCPVCGCPLWLDAGYGRKQTTVLTGAQMDAKRLAARYRMYAGGALDSAAVAALTAEIDDGSTFEEAAALYGRDPGRLREELEGWLGDAEIGDRSSEIGNEAKQKGSKP